jgi:hypothetical protein
MHFNIKVAIVLSDAFKRGLHLLFRPFEEL